MKGISALLGAIALVQTVSAGCFRGLPWAVDNNYAHNFVNRPKVCWYYHWQDGHVPQLDQGGLEFVPQFWGPSSSGWNSWGQRKNEMYQKAAQHVLGFNEPDLGSQSNVDPYYAAQLYMQEMMQWHGKGTKVGTPAIAYNLDWMNTFLSSLYSRGGYCDFMVLHWYGSWNDLAGFQKYVSTAHSRFGLKIWVTEIGITSASNPSQAQVKNFMVNAVSWMETVGYCDRVAWFGAFLSYAPPDGYATGKNAHLSNPTTPTDQAYWYFYTGAYGKRSLASRHHVNRAEIEAPADEEENTNQDGALHCDERCLGLKSQIDQYEAGLAAGTAQPLLPPAHALAAFANTNTTSTSA